MPGGIYINQEGGNHYSFAKLDYEAEDAEYKDAGLRSDSEFRLQDNSVVDRWMNMAMASRCRS